MACNEVVWPVVSYRQHTPSVSGSLHCVSWTWESLYLWPCIDCLRGMNFTLVTLVSFFGHACCYSCKARLANFGISEYIGSRFPIPNVPCGACDNREFDWCMGWFTWDGQVPCDYWCTIQSCYCLKFIHMQALCIVQMGRVLMDSGRSSGDSRWSQAGFHMFYCHITVASMLRILWQIDLSHCAMYSVTLSDVTDIQHLKYWCNWHTI